MANIVDKFMDFMKLGYEEEEDEEERLQAEQEDEPAGGLFRKAPKNNIEKEPKAKNAKKEKAVSRENTAKNDKQNGFSKKVSVVKGGNDNNMSSQIVSIRPVDDSAKKKIGTELLNGKNVLINLEGLDSDIAQRVVDFTAGVCFAIDGNMKYPSKYFVLAVPNQVELSGAFEGDEAAADNGGAFNGVSFDKFRY